MNSKELEERLIGFSVKIVGLVEKLPDKKSALFLGGQLLRSGTSPALNYGEARGAESRKDFLHKMKVCVKELRESFNCMKIIHGSGLYKEEAHITAAIRECDELISIFVSSIKTASKNNHE